MIRVCVRLQAVAHLGQEAAVQEGGGHDVGAKIDQQVVVDQRGGSLPQTRAAQCPCPLAVVTLAKGFGVGIRSGGSQKGEKHLCHRSSLLPLRLVFERS
jgi:hypothetical protein